VTAPAPPAPKVKFLAPEKANGANVNITAIVLTEFAE
jgi:hypothetical protein